MKSSNCTPLTSKIGFYAVEGDVFFEKLLLIICLLSFTMVGCSNNQSRSSDVLSEVADFNFLQSFDLEEEKSVAMAVEIYENGHRKGERLMYFGNYFKGKGNIQFSYFRPDYSINNSNLIESFIVGAIQDETKMISNKIINSTPFMGYIFDAAKENVITSDGEYTIGVLGYLTDEAASTSFEKIQIQERLDFIEAYETYPLVYLVVLEIQ